MASLSASNAEIEGPVNPNLDREALPECDGDQPSPGTWESQ
jgi:hypothetical protein